MNYWPGTTIPFSRCNAFDLSTAGALAEQMAKEQVRVDNGRATGRRVAAQMIQIDSNPAATRAKAARLSKARI